MKKDAQEYFSHYTDAEMFENAGVKAIEPMTAKELSTEEEQNEILGSSDYYIEEKFDGTRGILQFFCPRLTLQDEGFDSLSLQMIILGHGSGFEGGEERIYNYFREEHSPKEYADFLKHEYGVGGHTCENNTFVESGSKGIKISFFDEDKADIVYPWSVVSKVCKELVDRGQYYKQEAFTRCFSRRKSVKTDFYTENTDSLPQIRDINIPELYGTVIDGEMFIPNRPFKDVSATLNCKWDKAVDRQKELGDIVFHAFDILYYKGVKLENMKLYRRKEYLKKVIDVLKNNGVTSVVEVPFNEDSDFRVVQLDDMDLEHISDEKDNYPVLIKDLSGQIKDDGNINFTLSKRGYYEYIVWSGGEGVMLKPKDGRYYHKRGREYLKIKKFLTREMILVGFTEPTKEYNGKFPKDKWQYWLTPHDEKYFTENESAKELEKKGYIPITRFYYEDYIGNLQLGVIITEKELDKLPKNKIKYDTFDYKGTKYLIVCECAGISDEEREWFTEHGDELLFNTVVEVKANEIFRDTGKLRHPRYLRIRTDKLPNECSWSNHINQ
jgi:ATP-dependent DNA ligase